MRVTRIAPSPTGALHLGNARTFLATWLLARQNGWRVVLRVEDLDGPRVKAGADRQAIQDLTWLGLDWDEGPVYQTMRYAEYEAAIEQLLARGEAYPCVCTRKDVAGAASAPHGPSGDKVPVYPGTCRGKFASVQEAFERVGKIPAVRFKVPEGTVEFIDRVKGNVSFDVARLLGDFVTAKSEGTASYQLAVVVDDAAMGVTDVVRADDLLDSTPRQILLYHALELTERIPAYCHLPLVVGPDGRRLAKRHGDTRLAAYRVANVAPARVLALMARWLGVEGAGDAILLDDLLKRFKLENVPREPIAFTEADDAFLRAGT
jgi:glutamyl-tRNA synthetase